jgi:hypothetical protein
VPRFPAGVACVAACATLAGGALGVGPPSATGCTTNQCDPNTAQYPDGDGGDGRVGEMVDENTYETSPVQQPVGGSGSSEPWIRYPGNVTLTVRFPPAAVAVIGPRSPVWIDAYVGVSAQPNAPDSNFTQASGGLVETYSWSPAGFIALNSTCASYYARFVVHFPARDGSAQVPLDASE